VAAAAWPLATPAVTHTWNGGNSFGPTSMNNSLNWSGGTPVSGSSNLTLIFPSSGQSTPNQDITSPFSVQSVTITAGMGYTMNGSQYQFSNLGANPSLTTTGAVTFNAQVSFNAPTALSVNSATLNLNGSLFGSGDVNVTGNSNVVIGGLPSNLYSGTMTVNSGVGLTLQRTAGQALNGDLVVNGATAQLIGNNQFGVSSDIVIDNAGQITTSQNQLVRDLRVDNGGSFTLNSTNTLTISGVISSLAGSGAIGNNPSNFVSLGGLRTINVQSTGATDLLSINSSISNGRFDKQGPGVLSIFSSNNTFSGQNVISAGTVRGNVDSIGTDVLNNATLELYGGNFNSTVVSGSGQVAIVGAGVTYNAAQSYSGGTEVRSGGNLFGTSATLTGAINGGAGSGVVIFDQAASGTFGGTLTGSLLVNKQGAGTVTLGGTNTYSLGTNLTGGGLQLTTDTAIGSGYLFVAPGPDPATLEAVGSRTFANQFSLGYNLGFVGSGNFNFTDTTPKSLFNTLTHNSTGNTTIAGKFALGPSASIVVNSGTLVLGDPAAVGGFSVNPGGAVTVNGGTLTVRSLNFTTLPDVTLAGGTLNAPNGYAIPLGAALQGNGGVTGRVASANGSTILANGNLTIGDAAHVAGVNLDGELYTNQFTVALADANQAVLGSLTHLGNGGTPGVLAAANGLVLNFGRNLAGYGQVQSTNALANAVIVNGDASGNSLAQPLNFTGYVKGVGTFNNVTFSGTFAPGLSPALLTVGSVGLSPSSVLEMEIGGLSRGGQYDAFDVTGTYLLDGTLSVLLINGFNPSLGDQFDMFNGSTTGTFDTMSLPPLSPGLAWDSSNLYTTGVLEVVPEPAGALAWASVAAVAGLLRRRRR
jgi:autotransporter-associated beta strand protein